MKTNLERVGRREQLRLAVAVFAVFLLMAGICMPSAVQAAETKPQVIRLAHVTAEGSHFDYAAKKFAELVAQKTDGKVKVEIYPAGQLGDERTVLEALQIGGIEATIIGHDPLAQFTPVVTAISLPYIFRNREHAYKVLSGPFGDEIRAATLKKGMRVVEFGENGYRVISNSVRPITKPADVVGLRIRSPQSPVNLAVTKALGGNPVAAPFTEVYTMLQQRVIDGQENALPQIYDSKYYEVNKYLSLTNHIMTFTVFLVSEKWFDTLSPEMKQIVLDLGKQAMMDQRTYSQNLADNVLVNQLKQAGMEVNAPDLEPFREATKNVHKEFIPSFGQKWYDLIVDTK